MTEPRDDSFDRLLRQTLRQAPSAGATPSCLDAETMAAWVDGGLSGADLAAAEAHAATCSRCRALAAVMVRSETAEHHPAEVLASAPQGPRARNWWPWLVPLAAAALVAMAIWIPRRAQQPTQESTVTLASPAETAPQVPPLSGKISERQQIPSPQQEAQTAAAKETGSAPLTFRTAPPAAAAVPSVAPGTPPPAPAPATPNTFAAASPAPPPPSADALRALDRLAPETVIAEFQSPEALAERVAIDAAARGGAPLGRGAGTGAGSGAGTGAGTGAGIGPGIGDAGGVGGAGGRAGTGPAGGPAGAGGRGGGGRGAAAPRAGAVGGTAALNPSQPTRWRVLASGIVERSNPPGGPWDPVAIEVAGARVTSGAAPSSLVCWLVGRSGLVLLTIDGRSFTRVMFPETVDLASVRATSARMATVTTIDGRTFVTMDGGENWRPN